MLRPFGEEMRWQRENAGKTMKDMAKALGLSVGYISDVERGHRAPLDRDRILRVAEVLGVPPEPLLLGRAVYYGHFELPCTPAPESRVQLGMALMSRWDLLTEEEVEALLRILVLARRRARGKSPGL